MGLARKHWSTAAPIRAIFRQAFEAAGPPYFNPHSFRSTLLQLGQTLCRDPEPFKAWSQHLGREGVLTTFLSYGSVAPRRQGQILKGLELAHSLSVGQLDHLAQAVVRTMHGAGMSASAVEAWMLAGATLPLTSHERLDRPRS